VLPVAIPLITAHLGLADSAVALGRKSAAGKGDVLASAVGEVMNAGRIALGLDPTR
jgi:hypothetical protein